MRTIGAIPGASLRPLIGLCEALSWTFQGVRNSIDPEMRRRFEEKYRTSASSQEALKGKKAAD